MKKKRIPFLIKRFLIQFLEQKRGTIEIKSKYVDYYSQLINYDNPCFEDLRFVYDYCIYTDENFVRHFFTPETPEFKFLLKNKDLFCKYFDSTQIIGRITYLFSNPYFGKNLIIENFDTVLIKPYLFYSFYPVEISLSTFSGDHITNFSNMDSSRNMKEEKIYEEMLLKAFMYKKIGDEKKFAQYADPYLSYAWNDYWKLHSWVSTYLETAECSKEDSIYCEGVLKRMLSLEKPEDCYAHTHYCLAALYYKQGNIHASVHYFNNMFVPAFNSIYNDL